MLNRYLFFITFIFYSSISLADDSCPFPEVYIEFDIAYHQCAHQQVRNNESCDYFIKNIEKLFPKYDCKRSFDTEPVPAIWLFDAAMEDYLKVLHELALGEDGLYGKQWFVKQQTEAKRIFISDEFRAVLDGHLAEIYSIKIKSITSK